MTMNVKNNYTAPEMEQFDIDVQTALCLSGIGNTTDPASEDDWGTLS